MIFTGKHHIKVKITGKGAIKDLKNNRRMEVNLKENKIFSFDLNIDDKNDVSQVIMTVKYFHNIIYENGEICFKFFMDEDILYLKCDETDWTCSFCGITKNKKEDYLYCKRCNFYLCITCLQNYKGIIYDVI